MKGNSLNKPALTTRRNLIINLLKMDHIGAPHPEEEFGEAKAKLLEAIMKNESSGIYQLLYLHFYKELYSFMSICRRQPGSPILRPGYLNFRLPYRRYGRLTDKACHMITYSRMGLIGATLAKYP